MCPAVSRQHVAIARALAMTIVAVTVLTAIVYELVKGREYARHEAGLRTAEALDAQELVTA